MPHNLNYFPKETALSNPIQKDKISRASERERERESEREREVITSMISRQMTPALMASGTSLTAKRTLAIITTVQNLGKKANSFVNSPLCSKSVALVVVCCVVVERCGVAIESE